MSIWVIIDTFKSNDVIRLRRHYNVKITLMSSQQLRHVIIQQIKAPNKSFNLSREILSKLQLKSLKIGSTLF